MNEFLLIFGMFLVTFMIRYPVIGMSGHLQFSDRFLQILRFVPPAVLTAIVVPAVLMPDEGQLNLSYWNARLVGAIATILISIWRKNLLWSIVGGMAVFLGWQWLLKGWG